VGRLQGACRLPAGLGGPGRPCDREVERYRSRRLRDGELDDREVVEALERAREQQTDLIAIVERLERAAEAQRRFLEAEVE
jgi:hypothetical protein